MQSSTRVVITTPIGELWDECGAVVASRSRDLSSNDLRDLLRRGPLRFVVAEVGALLRWHQEESCFAFWKAEVQSHLAAPGVSNMLDDFPGGYCYFASEWTPAIGSPIVVLELAH